jgi:putative copper resistance protein D
VLTPLLDVFSFVSVLLRGAALAFQSLVLGGVIFTLWILRPLGEPAGAAMGLARSARQLMLCSAVALAFVQSSYVATNAVLLAETTGLAWGDVIGANFFLFGTTCAIASLIIAAITARRDWRPGPALLLPALVILVSLIATSHAAGRVGGRTALALLGALHMLSVAAWIGGLACLVLTLAQVRDFSVGAGLCRRFSRLALLSVLVLAGTGWMLSRAYIDSPEALYGTGYGLMVMSKTILFIFLLILGGLNFLIVRRMASGGGAGLIFALRRFTEAEVGVGFTVVLAAASLSSQPPAVDMQTDRLQLPELFQRWSPRWPSFNTPPVHALSPATPLGFDAATDSRPAVQSFVPGTSWQPNTPDDIAWSEYNHHWAGVIVLAAGLLAVAAPFPRLRFARHWPLIFLALAVFLFFRADPENWPLGPRSFWQSFTVAEVLQHRLFVLLIVIFAVFEWAVVTRRIASHRAALVFPGVCAAGGALLLTHAHPLGNIREELLAEFSHIPLAIFAVIAGWSRWLELRFSGRPAEILMWIWPVCFVLIGVILLNYREA